MKIELVTNENRDRVLSLLQKAALPVADINNDVELFALQDQDGKIIGTIGWQTDGETGLLRTSSIDETQRGKQLGSKLVDYLEKLARAKGIKEIYLLTTTAAPFFLKNDFKTINRHEAAFFIQQTSEFVSVCPSSALVMKKEL